MTDLSQFAAPKSDQLNADDLIGRTMTIKITRVTGQAGDQPVSIFFEGDNGKPYKPCKSMIRVLIHAWTKNGANYVGRYLTLYRDEKVRFGGIEVGGIRISHMSHIPAQITMSLTSSKAKRAPYTVKPLQVPNEDPHTAALVKAGNQAASNGATAYTGWLGQLSPGDKEKMRPYHSQFSQTAQAADRAATAMQPSQTAAPVGSSEPPAPDTSERAEKQEPESTIPDDAFPGDIPTGMSAEDYYNQQAGRS